MVRNPLKEGEEGDAEERSSTNKTGAAVALVSYIDTWGGGVGGVDVMRGRGKRKRRKRGEVREDVAGFHSCCFYEQSLLIEFAKG